MKIKKLTLNSTDYPNILRNLEEKSMPKQLYWSGADSSEFNQVLTMLEIGGKIRPLGMNNWGVF